MFARSGKEPVKKRKFRKESLRVGASRGGKAGSVAAIGRLTGEPACVGPSDYKKKPKKRISRSVGGFPGQKSCRRRRWPEERLERGRKMRERRKSDLDRGCEGGILVFEGSLLQVQEKEKTGARQGNYQEGAL